MKNYLLIALTILLSSCVQQGESEIDKEKDMAEIEALRKAELRAVLSGNIDSLMVNRTDDFIAMLPGMPAVEGKDQVRKVLEGMFGQMKEFEHNTITEEIFVSGDLAVHRGTYTDNVILASNDTLAYEGKFLWVLKRQSDGTWKYIIQTSNKSE